jgi:hypothetical protein
MTTFPVPEQTTGASQSVDGMPLHVAATAGESLDGPNAEQSAPVSASRTGGATPPTGANSSEPNWALVVAKMRLGSWLAKEPERTWWRQERNGRVYVTLSDARVVEFIAVGNDEASAILSACERAESPNYEQAKAAGAL